jgi:hypothetical protein
MPMNPRLLVPRATFDPDAAAYLRAVEAADGQALETPVKRAVDDFFRGTKADGTFSALKAACILCGARTLAGALVPLAGTAPTNNNFVDADYNRETGLVGNGSTKYLDSNRAENADPQMTMHIYLLLCRPLNGAGQLLSSVRLDSWAAETDTNRIFRRNSVPQLQGLQTQSVFWVQVGYPARHLQYRVDQSDDEAAGASRYRLRAYNAIFQHFLQIFRCLQRNGIYRRPPRLLLHRRIPDLAALDARVTALVTAIGAAL